MNKILLPLFAALLALRCGLTPLAGGSTDTELGSVVIGTVHDEEGRPVPHAEVRLIPEGYNPVNDPSLTDAGSTVTDSNGSYCFSYVTKGNYSLLAATPSMDRKLLITGIAAGATDTVPIRTDTLRKTGAIAVDISEAVSATNGYIYIPSTLFLARVARRAVLSGLPAGRIPSIRYTRLEDTTGDYTIDTGVTVLPGDTAIIADLHRWSHAGRIVVNTSATGANVANDVIDFPLIIRLSAANFTFSEAQGRGEDLRFAKPDGTPLPYEIERWDSANAVAEIWVTIDMVRGNNSTQSISVFWGNQRALAGSNSTAVFDTARGFQGIWHLGEPSAIARDATGNRYDGTGYNTLPVAGMIGNAQWFNGTSGHIHMQGTAASRLSFPMNGRYMVSAWVYHDTLADSATYLIAGKGEHQYFMKTFDLALSTRQRKHQWEFTEYHENDLWQAATLSPAAAKNWVHIVGVRNGTDQYLYVNGTLAMEGYQVIGTGGSDTPRDSSEDFSIGAFLRPVTAWNQGYASFNGAIDEVNVSSVPRSADWIKLCYMNQRADDKLTVFHR